MDAIITDRLPCACHAPDLTDEKLAEYEALISAQPAGELRDALGECYAAVALWWSLPESTRDDGDRFKIRHGGRDAVLQVTPLTDELVGRLHAAVPWPHELAATQQVFDAIPAEQRALRDCAFHLLWHVTELSHDREPLTQGKLPSVA
jgi:hypothetical protein